jgi:toxin YoeB
MYAQNTKPDAEAALMKKLWSDRAWEEYSDWQTKDKKTLKRINMLIKSIERNGFNCIGKPEPLVGNLSGWWSVRIDEKNRLIFSIENNILAIHSCLGHYE